MPVYSGSLWMVDHPDRTLEVPRFNQLTLNPILRLRMEQAQLLRIHG
jgi:hypothetical protein